MTDLVTDLFELPAQVAKTDFVLELTVTEHSVLVRCAQAG